MAALTANNGRIVFSPAVAIKARLSFQHALLRGAALRVASWLTFRSDCNDSPPRKLRFRRFDCARQAPRPIRPASIKAAAPFQRVGAASIGKWTNGRGVKELRGGRSGGAGNLSRREPTNAG